MVDKPWLIFLNLPKSILVAVVSGGLGDEGRQVNVLGPFSFQSGLHPVVDRCVLGWTVFLRMT